MSHAEPPGGVNVGQAGLPLVRYRVTPGPVAAAQAIFDAASPWVTAPCTPLIQTLMNAGVTYAVETLDELFWWARVRLVTQDLLAFSVLPPAAGDSQSQRKWKSAYQVIEAQRTEFQRVGELNPAQHQQILTCLTRQYVLTRQAASHYYASRGGNAVTYTGRLTVGGARSILNGLGRVANNQPFDPATLDDGAVDEFVCAFFAEPTRWREEQVFNLLALFNAPVDTVLTGANGILPMAAGTTWDQALGVVGAQVPKRVWEFAHALGMDVTISQELALAGALPAFLTAMRAQYEL
jgi:hypothetical protein